jgi:hypothetical protein
MNLDIDRPEQQIEPERRRSERDLPLPPRPPGREPLDDAPAREREAVRGRNSTYRISAAERATLYDIGRFRTVAVEDIGLSRYPGRAQQLREDLDSLTAQGLVQRRTAFVGGRQRQLDVLVLTRAGKDLLQRARPAGSTQAVYAGFVKPSEVAHDAAIYRMYQAEAVRIAKQGGTIRRLVLDYELKKKIYSPLAKAKHLPPAEYAKRQALVAEEHHLKVVRGKIPLPDLRIEFETRDGETSRVDLELATHHYHGSHLQAKADAGFTFYAAAADAAHLTRVMDEREITAVILSM